MDKIYEQVLMQIRATWRRRWWILLFAWPIAIAGWAWQTTLPDSYTASAQVNVDTDSILRPLLRGMSVAPNNEQRVRMMSQNLLTRANLEKVAREVDLDLLVDGNRSMDSIVDDLSRGVRLTSGRDNDVYTVRFQHQDPAVAQKVVQAVLDMFIEAGLGDSRRDLLGSQQFIDSQLEAFKVRLDEKEREIENFKREHVGLLSAGGGSHYQRMENVAERLRSTQLELREALNQRELYQRQVKGEEPVLLFSEDRNMGDPELAARINGLRRNLDELRRRYTDQHPDVVSTRRMLDELEEERDSQPTFAGGSNASQGENLYFQQMRVALTQAESRVSTLQTRVSDLESQRAALAESVDRIPRIESDYASLQRDHNVLKSNYEQLLATRERALLTSSVETGGDMVDFRVLEPPRLPSSPSSPDRPVLVSGSLLFGLAAGTGFAFLLAQLRSTFTSPSTLSELTGRPFLGSVSRVATRRDNWRRRLGLLMFSTLGLLLLLAYAAVMLHVLGHFGLDL